MDKELLNGSETVYVLIPVFNETKYLHKTLSHVVLSSYKNIRVYVLDDASTDVLDYRFLEKMDKRIKVFRNNNNIGKASSINIALMDLVPRGSIVYIIDADSIVEEHTIEKLYYAIRKENYDVVGGRIKTIEKSFLSRLVSYEFGVMFEQIHVILSSFKLPHPIHGTNFMMVDKGSIFDPSSNTEDFDFFAKNLEYLKFGYVKDAVISEYSPATFGSYLRQRQRWVSGFLRVFGTYWNYWIIWFILLLLSIPCAIFSLLLVLLILSPNAALVLFSLILISNLIAYRRLDAPFFFLALGAVYAFVYPIITILSIVHKEKWQRTEREI